METGKTASVPGTDKISILMRRVQELEDREAIRNVLDAFSSTADVRDMEAQVPGESRSETSIRIIWITRRF